MPYYTNAQLPLAVQAHLPLHAQDIYRQAFNQAFMRYGDEALAHRVGWSAVKKSYVKLGEGWSRRGGARLRY